MTTNPETDSFNFFVPQTVSEIPDHPVALAQEQALTFIQRLATEDGAIVSTGICTPEEIATARADNRMFVDHEGLGYILRPSNWRQMAEKSIYLFQRSTN